VVLGGGLALAGAIGLARLDGQAQPWASLLAVVTLGSVAFRSTAPLLMVGGFAAGLTAYSFLPAPGTPLPFFIGILVVAFSLGDRLEGRERLAAVLGLMAAGLVLQLQTRASATADELSWADVYLTPLVIVGGPALAGGLLRRARHQARELRRLTVELAEERRTHAAAAALAERARIARELHDVISHSVTVMVVQAGAAEQQLPADGLAAEQIRAIRKTGKEALAELRRQLGVLRSDETSALAPMPGLVDIKPLAEGAGAAVTFEGDPRTVPAGPALAAYRVVQECLTNVRRHAAGAAVSVQVCVSSAGVDVVIQDTGGSSTSAGGGYGLRGIIERVEMYGGRVEAGRCVDGAGWRVHAWIPVISAGDSP
jgi:signal transduction histidine kinase